MLKLHFAAITTALVIIANCASAASNSYIRGGLGVGAQKVKEITTANGFVPSEDFSKSGTPYLGEFAVGYREKNMRTELQYHHSRYDRKASPDGSSLKNHVKTLNNGVFINGYYDVATYNAVSPYLMAGVGFINSHVKFQDVNLGISSRKSKNSFAYQAGAGLNIHMNKDVDWGIGYRFINKSNNKSVGSATQAGTTFYHTVKQQPIHAGVLDVTAKF